MAVMPSLEFLGGGFLASGEVRKSANDMRIIELHKQLAMQANISALQAAQQTAVSSCSTLGGIYGWQVLQNNREGNRESNPAPARSGAESGQAAKPSKLDDRIAAYDQKRDQECAWDETPKLTHENSPMFGRPAFGPFYNWTFDSPLKPLKRRLLKFAWSKLRAA